MRSSLLTLFFLIILFNASAQIALSVNEAGSQGINLGTLDSLYISGIGADSIETAFKGQEDAYVTAYYELLRDLNTHLNTNNFRWGGQVRCFNRIYFKADGSIDYYLYDFEEPLSEERERAFRQLLGAFIADYQFSLKATRSFRQCSPANYRDLL